MMNMWTWQSGLMHRIANPEESSNTSSNLVVHSNLRLVGELFSDEARENPMKGAIARLDPFEIGLAWSNGCRHQMKKCANSSVVESRHDMAVVDGSIPSSRTK